ncbi:MAG: helix-turn-helix domain-containing protein [Phycisphaeraceae bacterium]|nr:helix-turn-helix domain-containing protein [Phycisphaeraceae bacterium]
MAKMFYTLEEAAAKLGKSPQEVRDMASSGQLQEFRDRDKLVFKREQVDLLSGNEQGDDVIPLADSGEAAALADDRSGSGSGSGGGSPTSDTGTKERSGISIFEGDEGESDPSAQTQVTASIGGVAPDPGASGSGLLDLTREAEGSKLGAQLLDDVYSGGEQGGGPAPGDSGESGALFESAGVASDVGGAAAPAMMMVAAEPYDGTWSGIAGGLALGMVLVLGVLGVIVLSGLVGWSGMPLTKMFAENFWMYVGILGGAVAVFGVVGMVLGKKS